MNKEFVIDAMKAQGKADALDLRSRASGMTGTEIIAEEEKIPSFIADKDYSQWTAGAPVQYDGQVYTLITPHNASYYEGDPSTLPALWSITHTKDPAKAKPYMAPNGTSGMYMLDEYCTKDGYLWHSLQDNNPYSPGDTGTDSYWEQVSSN